MTNPFTGSFTVPLPDGELYVASAGFAPQDAERVVLAAHGITASHVNWRTVARELDDVCLLAPDLRGRGASRTVGPPFGIATHASDLLAVLDHIGRERAVLAGHSMGAYVVARLAADHPDRAEAVVLVDGGLPVPSVPDDIDPNVVLDAMLGPAIARLKMIFDSAEDYVAFFAQHPALTGRLDEDVEAYVRYDLEGEAGALRSRASEEAVRADGADLLLDKASQTAVDRIAAPITLLRAERGLLDDDHPLIPPDALERFRADHPEAVVHDLAGVNHYTIALGTAGSATTVAEAIRAA